MGKIYNNFSWIFDSGRIITSKGPNYFFNKVCIAVAETPKKLCTAIQKFRKRNLLLFLFTQCEIKQVKRNV